MEGDTNALAGTHRRAIGSRMAARKAGRMVAPFAKKRRKDGRKQKRQHP